MQMIVCSLTDLEKDLRFTLIGIALTTCICSLTGFERNLRFTLVGMALTPWFAEVKAKCEKGDEKDSKSVGSAKVLCTPYEKQLKKMDGNLSFIKVCFFVLLAQL